MKHFSLRLILVLLIFVLAAVAAAQSEQSGIASQRQEPQKSNILGNRDVVDMVKAGLSTDIVIAKIKSSTTVFDTSPASLAELKVAGVPDAIILAMVQAATSNNIRASLLQNKPTRIRDELTSSFKQLQSTVVTVWSDFGRGTGFIFDKDGLVMTNQHVIGPAEYIAVQFDERRKIPAVLLASSAEKDIAVLWIDLSALPDATVAPLAMANGDEPPVVEGERVLTIGSPLHQRKIMTTGIASKVEKRAIISDININHGKFRRATV